MIRPTMAPDDGPTPSDADGKGPGLMAGNAVVAQITLLEAHQEGGIPHTLLRIRVPRSLVDVAPPSSFSL